MAGKIFFVAGLFAHEDNLSAPCAFAKDGLGAAFPKVAGLAIGGGFTKSFDAFALRKKFFSRTFRFIFSHRTMNSALTKKEIESALVDRFGHVFERYERLPAETLSTGSEEIDDALQGFPRGAITEIHGAESSGRISLILSALSAASSQEEICAVVDCEDTFDLSSAANAGVDFDRLLWVRCDHNLERAFKAVDLILHSGGFGFVTLNLCDVPAGTLRRIVSSWWFRFRRAIENTPTAMIVLTPLAVVRSCASLALELNNKRTVWLSI